jgi:hypothetical protein
MMRSVCVAKIVAKTNAQEQSDEIRAVAENDVNQEKVWPGEFGQSFIVILHSPDENLGTRGLCIYTV